MEFPQKTVIILMGLPGCGKSTWAQTYFSGQTIINGDLLATNERVQAACQTYMIQSKFIIVDATNLVLERRAPLIALAKQYGYYVVGVYWKSMDSKICIERIAQRVANGGNKVSRVAVYALNKKKVEPVIEEGFNQLFIF